MKHSICLSLLALAAFGGGAVAHEDGPDSSDR